MARQCWPGYLDSCCSTRWVLGRMFDIELRVRTQRQANPKAGFNAGEIWRLLVQIGGQPLGDLYDSRVLNPGDLPVEKTVNEIARSLLSERLSHRNQWLQPHKLPDSGTT